MYAVKSPLEHPRQQPPDESLAAAALSLGLVEGMSETRVYLRARLRPDPWPAMVAYRRAVVCDGLRAREPAPGLLAGLVDLAEGTLLRRGRGEERYLVPIRARLESGVLPADRAVAWFKGGGVETLVDRVRLNNR